MSTEPYISLQNLPQRVTKSLTTKDFQEPFTLKSKVMEFEKQFLTEQLHKLDSPKSKDRLAEKLGISRATLYKKLSGFNLS